MGLILKGQAMSRFVQHRLLILTARPSKENLATLSELAESGKLIPVIDRTYALNEVPEAIRYLETDHARAKVTITVM
jgi:NADPH:quinone reductase-like Zn-dependent oxidoreductase